MNRRKFIAENPPEMAPPAGLLIDWLTLRCPIIGMDRLLRERLEACMGAVVKCDCNGELVWKRLHLDIDKLRSDSDGLFWTVQGDGKEVFLVIGGSPASLMFGHNVFGNLDLRGGAEKLRATAARSLAATLPALEFWQCRRVDITGNYALPDAVSVKQALRALVNTDGVRRKAQNDSRGGDTVYWAPSSDLTKGKAYHKGAHLRHLARKGKVVLDSELYELADRLLRLEHTRGARWFRRLAEAGKSWLDLNEAVLAGLYREFFEPLVSGLEVKDMGRAELVERIEAASGITNGRALAAFDTYLRIKAHGFEETKGSMARRTFQLHLKHLRAAGFSDAQLCAGNVVSLASVRILLATPVTCWAELRRAA